MAGSGHANHVDGKNSPVVLEVKQERPACGCLQPGAVMIRSVVVADRSVSTTCGYIQKIVEGILEKIALEVDAEGILRRCGWP